MHSLLCGLTPERIVYSLALLHRSEPDLLPLVGVADPGSSIADEPNFFSISEVLDGCETAASPLCTELPQLGLSSTRESAGRRNEKPDRAGARPSGPSGM